MFAKAMVVHIVFRRRRSSLQRAAYLLCYLAGIVVVAVVEPWFLVPVALVAAAATALGLWTGRDSYGVAHGLPRGKMPFVNLAAILDREHFVQRAERDGPVFKTTNPAMPSPTACVVGLPRAVALLRDNEEHLAPVGGVFDELIPGKLLRHMQGDAHRHYRRILRDAFDGEVIEQCQPEIEAILADGFAALSAESTRRRARRIDLHDTLERDFVLPVFLRVFLGLDPESEIAHRSLKLFLLIHQDMTGLPRGARLDRLQRVTLELDCIIRQLGEATATRLDDEVGTSPSFLSALLRSHPEALDDPTVVRNFIFTIRTGAIDVTGLLHWALKLLAENPRWLVALRETDDPSELADRVVMELLRHEQSELLYRYTTKDIELEGSVIPAGWLLRVCVRESHRDPEVFDEPTRFDPDRFRRPYSRTEYSPLGMLGHTCLGAGIVQTVASTFVRQLALDHDLSTVSDGRPVFAIHWRPSRRHHVVLRPRSA